MKQFITIKQWNELTNNEQQKFCDIIKVNYIDFNHQRNIESYLDERLNIGQMIEFLGDDMQSMFPKYYPDTICEWSVCLRQNEIEMFNEEKLADALWEAVKYKLNNITNQNYEKVNMLTPKEKATQLNTALQAEINSLLINYKFKLGEQNSIRIRDELARLARKKTMKDKNSILEDIIHFLSLKNSNENNNQR